MAANLDDINDLFRIIWGESMYQELRRHHDEQSQAWNQWIRDVYGPYWVDKQVKEPEIPEYLRVSEGL